MAASENNADEFCARSFDFIVVGGGTAGLAVAARLAENPSLTVGVLEAGVAPAWDDDIDIPGCSGRALGGPYDWHFETVPQPGLNGRTLPWNRGKVLGGSSALNFMTWNRASREDYDAWEHLGNSGWGWEALLPFFTKSETFHPPPAGFRDQHSAFYDAPTDILGTSGPINISYTTEFSPSHALWHSTLNSLGIESNKAHLSGNNVGVWTTICAVSPDNGTRSYAPHYCSGAGSGLLPANLHILTEALAQEIVLEKRGGDKEWTATGVRFTRHGHEHIVSVTHEVILSGGSVQSPQLLELSGVGQPEVLVAAGIQVKVDSPRVGENLQEHIMLPLVYEVDPSLPNPDDLQREDAAAAAREQWLKDHSGPYSVLPVSMSYLSLSQFLPQETHASLAARAQNLSNLPSSHQSILNSRFTPGTLLGQVEYVFDLGNWNPSFQPDPASGRKYGTMLQILQYPFSRGSIHIQSADIATQPRIDPGYYAGAHGALDLEIMTRCAQFTAKICATQPLASILQAPAAPGEGVDGGEGLREWVVKNTITDWHPVGTCAMGGSAGKAGGVVDERLRVYEVRGLRVVDASVMPLHISAHLQATVYAIAEKAARMILEDLGVVG
ncbi:hypothetical protein B0T25DRAFT_451790 [Lasiosphaeria hispida]|uniref:Glucose-methanol-choline oxidoreductase N-terminal domain-containing protein n=1 Tax=Lasiosphaeria hispida TaxID=260671 RepID=A0AAJ0MFV9_9PEZI|nr:hypothetical protein B0T25DRAFT_451790 [Lasiosphaeria hispida]